MTDDVRQATTPPVGVSSRQIFLVAMVAIVGVALVSGYMLLNGADAGERGFILQFWINAATGGFFYYLGSSAGSRNKQADISKALDR
jgi:hypothetical protein